jgi:hypothetical protein
MSPGNYSSLTEPLKDAPQQKMPVVAVDSLGLSRLDFLKIDVAGMKIDVLRGAQDTIHRFAPCYWVEYWKVNVDSIKASFDHADDRFHPMDRLNLLCAPVARMAMSGVQIDDCET